MTEQSSKAALYRKIAAVAGAIEAVERDGRNKDQGYRYATPASVMSAVKPLMAAHSLAIIPCQVHFEEVETGRASSGGKAYTINRVSMQYIVVDGESGEEMTVPWQAQAGTYGDDKGLAKAQTIALRTFLIQLFQIPAEDPEIDPDAGGRTPQQSRYEPPRQQPIKPPEKPAAPPNGTPQPQTREDWATALKASWIEEEARGGEVPENERLDLDNPEVVKTLTIEKIKELGKKSKARIIELRKQPA